MKVIIEWLSNWVRCIFPNVQAVSFATLLVVGVLCVVTLGNLLMPVFAAAVIAYLLDSLVRLAVRERIPRTLAVVMVYLFFLALVFFVLIGLLPLLYQQVGELIKQLPAMMSQVQLFVMQLPQHHPSLITAKQVDEIIATLRSELLSYGQSLLTYSWASLLSVITLTVYTILVPLLVFFFLKDKQEILAWFARYLPKGHDVSLQVWHEVDTQIGNYVRGKFLEIAILLVVTYVTFSLMGLNYALLLAVLIGLSVIIPYIGATLVTFPVILVALFQWGAGDEFFYLMLAYTIIQGLDGVVLVPLLFSEVVNLHPAAILLAILFFGGVGGFWGVFFAIPLATLVQAVLTAWPKFSNKNVCSPDY
ncbi:AI-2E family transporter [Candidatus Methylospira mobilis]|uniref:AI-2E family transporter n=1 Tax=Candidatus Methylospira mobilis TaxID=1808979 RepID=UPI0028E88935|nr:AI-2E family transporter [Candidatus Methylospira mobilis]WNV03323.1 AI-2E family transporter [Candidatus Methylospira mobilis]